MKIGMIHSTIDVFQEAFKNLQVNISLKKIENLAVMIHKIMTGPARIFHTSEHIFDMLDPSDPLHSLAALFHDIVYYQVDKGFPPEIFSILSPYIQEQEGEIFLAEKILPDDRLVMLTLDVFGFEAGQKLSPFGGLNEFLSALIMNNVLEGIFPEKELVQITVCIEATIPFRGKNDRGESWADILEQRLRNINKRYHISMQSVEIEDAIKRAVIFSNSDVESFAEKDVEKFLDGTWKLLPETNIALRSGELYSIRDYRQALQKMEGFFGFLNPDTIFTSYRGVPPEKDFQHMVKLAHTNIDVAREYLGIKLLAMAILEALAEMTGGDAPLALFMGDLRREEEALKRLEDFLPGVEASNSVRNENIAATPMKSMKEGIDNISSFSGYF